MEKQNKFQTKEQDKSPETDLNEMEISDLSDREFKITKMLTEVRTATHEQSENFNKETENVKKYQTEITEPENTIPEMKNSKEEFNSKLDQVEERISKLAGRGMELI